MNNFVKEVMFFFFGYKKMSDKDVETTLKNWNKIKHSKRYNTFHNRIYIKRLKRYYNIKNDKS